jgi:hypothetical protein
VRKLMVFVMVAVLGIGALAACSDGDEGSDGPGGSDQASDASDGEGRDDGGSDGAEGDPSDGDDGQPAGEPGQELALEAWAEEFCANFVGWLDAREANLDGIDTSVAVTDYPAQQAALEAFYTGEAAAADDLVVQLEQGSVPDLDDGEQLVADLTDLFGQLRDAAATAAEEVAALDPASSTFEADGQQLNLEYQTSLEDTGEQFTAISDEYPALTESATLEQQCIA